MDVTSIDVKVLSKNTITFTPPCNGMEQFFKLEHWRVKVGEREDDRIIWRRGDFVLIVALTNLNQVVLIQEYKQAVEQVLLCLPAGAKKGGETPQTVALRELHEESGYIGTKEHCHVLGPFFNSPDKSTERHFVVLLANVTNEGQPEPEVSETIMGVQLCPIEDAKWRLLVGLHRMAVGVAQEFLAKEREKLLHSTSSTPWVIIDLSQRNIGFGRLRILRVQMRRLQSRFVLVQYALDSEEQECGLIYDLDKRAFLDRVVDGELNLWLNDFRMEFAEIIASELPPLTSN